MPRRTSWIVTVNEIATPNFVTFFVEAGTEDDLCSGLKKAGRALEESFAGKKHRWLTWLLPLA